MKPVVCACLFCDRPLLPGDIRRHYRECRERAWLVRSGRASQSRRPGLYDAVRECRTAGCGQLFTPDRGVRGAARRYCRHCTHVAATTKAWEQRKEAA